MSFKKYSQLEEKAKSIETQLSSNQNVSERARTVLVGQAYSAVGMAKKGNFDIADKILDETQRFISVYVK